VEPSESPAKIAFKIPAISQNLDIPSISQNLDIPTLSIKAINGDDMIAEKELVEPVKLSAKSNDDMHQVHVPTALPHPFVVEQTVSNPLFSSAFPEPLNASTPEPELEEEKSIPNEDAEDSIQIRQEVQDSQIDYDSSDSNTEMNLRSVPNSPIKQNHAQTLAQESDDNNSQKLSLPLPIKVSFAPKADVELGAMVEDSQVDLQISQQLDIPTNTQDSLLISQKQFTFEYPPVISQNLKEIPTISQNLDTPQNLDTLDTTRFSQSLDNFKQPMIPAPKPTLRTSKTLRTNSSKPRTNSTPNSTRPPSKLKFKSLTQLSSSLSKPLSKPIEIHPISSSDDDSSSSDDEIRLAGRKRRRSILSKLAKDLGKRFVFDLVLSKKNRFV
jgi:hypothetical protein